VISQTRTLLQITLFVRKNVIKRYCFNKRREISDVPWLPAFTIPV